MAPHARHFVCFARPCRLLLARRFASVACPKLLKQLRSRRLQPLGGCACLGGPALHTTTFTTFTYFYTLHSAQASASPEAGRQETPWHA